MTFKELSELIREYKIPQDVKFMSDSGWECGATEMDGVYYNKRDNTIVFTQFFDKWEDYFNDNDWVKLIKSKKGEL